MTVAKMLTANDTGTTGGHQAGILVPKAPEILSFFPHLNAAEKNPRTMLVVREKESGVRWKFNFIYYNNKHFGGTRDEYRLTCMTRYLRAVAAAEGDELVFTKDPNGSLHVELVRQGSAASSAGSNGVLVLGSGWVCINL